MPIPKPSSPVIPERILLKDAVHETLLDAILTGELQPGAMLTDLAVAETYGATRASVRAALRRLANDGFVVVRPQAGTHVREVTPARTRDAIVMYSGILENIGLYAAAKLRDSDLAAMRRAARELGSAGPGYPGMAAIARLYDVVLARTDNPVLGTYHSQIAGHLLQAASVTGVAGLADLPVDRVLEAAEARDGSAFRIAAAAHLRAVGERFEESGDTTRVAGKGTGE